MAEEAKSGKPDYKRLGLKAGLEIHQQLETRKLFCNCPSYLRGEEPDFVIKRKLERACLFSRIR